MRTDFLLYCSPSIGQEEIDEVADSLRSGWLTTGPKVKAFEENFAHYTGAKHSIAVNSCTSALTVALAALDAKPGDEIILPTMTFCATANVVEHRGATPILADVGEDFQISLAAIERVISPRTRAIIVVHYGGQACDLQPILNFASERGLRVIQDAAHAVGSQYRGKKVGTHGLVTAFSFYPSKNMTAAEGGMLTTGDDAFASRLRRLSSFGINRETDGSREFGSWYYEVEEPGYKFNMTDLQAAIGIHQLQRLDRFNDRRREIALTYTDAFSDLNELILPADLPERPHGYHLYSLRFASPGPKLNRNIFAQRMAEAKIGTSVHFIPVHRHPFYSRKYSYPPQAFPVADMLFDQQLSLPLYPAMSETDVQDVVSAVRRIVISARR